MSNVVLTMKLLNESFAVCRLEASEPIPEWASYGSFFSITKTAEELSIVCPQENVPGGIKCEPGWRILKVEGPLDFSLIGILSSISSVLAGSGISIFAISTYDTDYILIKDEKTNKAIEVLSANGYNIISE
ncbi:ACT domain-containing protein [Peptoclostridium acidaminophilum]|nr:ACT domain-containing protein [Peptoclostridium acidaminophilum]